MGFNTHYLAGKSLAELCTFVRVDKAPAATERVASCG